MVKLLILIIIILFCTLLLSIFNNRKNKKDLKYIKSICENVALGNVNSRIKIGGTSSEIKALCEAINKVVNSLHNIQISEFESKESMKKMLSNVSHDLRTPLTVMLGYIDQINYNENLSEYDKKDYLLKLGKKTNEVIELINDFFSLSKLESGDSQLTLKKINISETLREVALNFYDIVTEKNLSMEMNIPDMDLFCYGDKEALIRVLNNLMTNSIKYGYDGNVIGLTLYEENNLVWIEQWDRGKGIALSEKNKIFQRLYTVEDSRNKNYTGSGLGLTIVETLIKKMQGDIFVESIPFKKTSFKFYLNKEINSYI